MSWWGKIIGGTLGMMVGGYVGALLGAALGHNFDKGVASNQTDPLSGSHDHTQTVFYTATFAVMGHVCKADGRVSEDEIELARQIMQQMDLNVEQREAAIHLFNQGKQTDFDLDAILLQFRKEIGFKPNLIQMFLEIQIMAAYADNVLHEKEREILEQVCELIRFPKKQFEQLVQMIVGMHGQHTNDSKQSIDAAYRVLGIDKQAKKDEVKRAYRKLMSQHHPDKLVAKGLPEEMMRVAKEKSQEIRQAYETIKQHKDF